ncbi:sigma-70 family RNA polymerase sigma factor [Chitinimonas lacunae]|uniref:Sigma-70 family RNA polymerase sigma factor n=1 Tax=Chitinimonas lacunae TaxID=1963018 RepID=A0ABV8MX41_9NEIS
MMIQEPVPEFVPPQQEAALWHAYRSSGDLNCRDLLLDRYLPFARMLAAIAYRQRYGDEAEFDDYLHFAAVALIEAMETFDPGREVPFTAFAAWRIRGGISDGVASYSDKQRQLQAQRRLAQRIDSLAEDEAEPSVRQAFAQLATVAVGLALGMLLEDSGMVEPDESMHFIAPAYHPIELEQLRRRIHVHVDRLPEREARLVKYHYFHGLRFDEVAELFEISKGRVSQLHKQALERLRHLLNQESLQTLEY